MVLQCLQYNNTETSCKGNFLECAKHIDCVDNGHCYVVWQGDGNANKPINAGCNPPYHSAPDDCQGLECTGQKKGSRFYCCCRGNFCNTNFSRPIQKLEDIAQPNQVNTTVETHKTNDITWSVIPIVVMFTIVLVVYIYWFRRGNNKNHNHHSNNSNDNRRNRGNLNDSELNELRNNHDISILMPFRNNFGADHPYINNNNNNNHNDQQRTLTNHLHLHDNVNNNNNINKQHNDIRIDLNNIKLLEIIGSGKFGTVHRAFLDESNDKEIAVKIIPAIEHSSWLNEHYIYTSPKIKHPNILNFLYSDEHLETETYWLVVEYASKGSLYSFLKENIITWKEFLHIALGIVRGLSHLHEADIAHRDFKSKNVLLKHDLTPCITDFGVAAILDTSGSQLDHRKKYLQVGTPRYMAPEVLECSVTFTKSSFTKIDVYALSLVLWELISRCKLLPETAEVNSEPSPYKLPFEDLAGPNPDINKMRQIVVVDKMRPTLRDEWRKYPASEFCRAIEDGWEYDHDARISASCFVERVESLPQSH